MMRWRSAAVVALVVLAGCGAIFPSGGSGGGTPTETLTPVPLSPVEKTATPETNLSQYPGVGPDGRIDPQELARSHVRVISNRSYTLVWSRRVTDSSGETLAVGRSFRQTARVESNSTFIWTKRGQTVVGREVTYVDDDGRFVRRTGPNGSTTTNLVRSISTVSDARQFFANTIRIPLLNILNEGTDVELVERNGRQYVRFQSNTSPRLLRDVFDSYVIRNYTATVYVTTDGYVRSLYFTYDLRRDGQTAHVERRYIYRDVGDTEVVQPNWVTSLEAAANTTTTPNGTARATPDETTVSNATTSG